MKLQDKETLSIASTVANVLEGKKEVKEVKFPHKMYHPDTGESVDIKTEEEHDKYTAKGWVHEKPAVKEVDEPKAKGEKEFKDKHTVKKSGMNNDGSVTKEEVELEEGLSASDLKKAQAIVNDPKTKGGNMTQAIKDLEKWKKGSSKDKKVSDMLRVAHESANEEVTISVKEAHLVSLEEAKKAGRGKSKVDIDWIGDKKQSKDAEKKHKVKIKPTGRSTADVSGEKKSIVALLSDPDVYGMDQGDIEDLFPELFEAVVNEAKFAVSLQKNKLNRKFDGDTLHLEWDGKSITFSVTGASQNAGDQELDPADLGMKAPRNKKDLEAIGKKLANELSEAKLPEYSSEDEMSPKQKKYQAFFNKALKKFGVKSPQELEGDKRKEFFDYIDANWKGDNESD